MQGADRSSADPFRPDLEGLRGIAILLVLAFHAGLPFAGGGFVGVDVFFVLSGFLITGLLVRERQRTGRIGLRAFYARRARRILPAAAVVLLATLALSWALLSPLDLIRVSGDALASALSLGNVRFAIEATDYFSAGVTPSPFLHYWSLGVEEQFYLLWPALLVGALALPRPRLAAGLVLAAVLAGSLALAVGLTDAAPAWAFYSLPSRAWQLALGGLLAVLAARGTAGAPAREPEPLDVFADGPDLPPGPGEPIPASSRRRLLPGLAVALAGWAGLLAILAAVLVIDPGTPYPGLAALAPSLGAAALIGTGGRPFSPGALLVLAPLRALGRISYSLYLVHWPVLVLPAASLAIGEELPLQARLALAALSILLAALCYRFVELPFHRGRVFALRPGRTLALAGASVAATAVIALGVGTAMSRDLDSSLAAETSAPDGSTAAAAPGGEAAVGAAETAPPSPGAAGDPGPTAISSEEPPSGPGGAPAATNDTLSPTSTPSAAPASGSGNPGDNTPSPGSVTAPTGPPSGKPAPTQKPTPAPTLPPPGHPTGRQPLPANVRPSLVNAANDWEQIERDGCTLSERAVQPTHCVYGDPKGTYTVALVGDSHAAQWFPAVEKIALERGWKLIPFTKLACRFVDLPIYSRTLKREFTECEAWRKLVVQQLQQLKPDLVLVSSAEGMAPMVTADDNPTRQGVAMGRLLSQIPGQIGVIVDTPWSIYDVPSCISRHLNDVTPCETTRAAAYTWRYLKLENAATKASAATLIDMSTAICPWDPCPVVLNGMIVYRDAFHLTATFAESLAPALEAALPKPQAGLRPPAGTGLAELGTDLTAAVGVRPSPGPGQG